MLSFWESVIRIFCVAIGTFITRVIPFALFGGNKTVPDQVRYLGKVLPAAIIVTLIIYCLKDIEFTKAPYGMAEIISIIVVGVLHMKWRNILISMSVGTTLYMILIRYI